MLLFFCQGKKGDQGTLFLTSFSAPRMQPTNKNLSYFFRNHPKLYRNYGDLRQAIRNQNLTESLEILEQSGIEGEVALFTLQGLQKGVLR